MLAASVKGTVWGQDWRPETGLQGALLSSREVTVSAARGAWSGWNELEKHQHPDLLRLGVGSGGGDTSRTPGSLGWEPSRTASTLTMLRTEGHTLPRDRVLSVRLEIGDQGSLSDGIRGVCCLVLVIFGL